MKYIVLIIMILMLSSFAVAMEGGPSVGIQTVNGAAVAQTKGSLGDNVGPNPVLYQEGETNEEAVKAMLQEKNILATQLRVGKVEITPNKVMAGESTVEGGEKKEITIEANGRTIMVKQGEGAIVMEEDGMIVNAQKIAVHENKLMFGDVEIQTPKEAIKTKKEVVSVELKEDETGAKYKVEVKNQRKFLGIFKVQAKETMMINAQNGETLQTKTPWWSFLSTDPEDTVDDSVLV